MSARLFVSIPVPQLVGKYFVEMAREIPEARPVRAENIHLTLKFLGHLDEGDMNDLIRPLQTVRIKRFMIEPAGLELSPRRGAPSVMWMGLSRLHPFLLQLRKQVNDVLIRAGVEPDTRSFHPHITMARFPHTGVSRGKVEAWLKRIGEIGAPPFEVEQFQLLRSRLHPTGAEYEEIENFLLL